jgi:putative transposase
MKKDAKNQDLVKARSELRLVDQIRQGLLDFTFAAGMCALQTLLEEDRVALCGPRYAHDPSRVNSRAGKTAGLLTFGGRKVLVERPRVRSASGHEVALESWENFSSEDPFTTRVYEQMLVGVSTRNYRRSLEPFGVESKESGVSKSSVSRRFVEKTTAAMHEWLSSSLEGLKLVCVMIDGIRVHDHTLLVALGVDVEGNKHVLGVRLGATENADVTRALIEDLVDRGMRERSLLFVLDGSKALRKAVVDAFGTNVLIQRCQVHKMRNVLSHLPESEHKTVHKLMRQAYETRNAKRAKVLLLNLVRMLSKAHPDAARSLEEGLDETLTVMAFNLPEKLERFLSTTNAIESLMSRARDTTRRVKRWRDGTMVLRWMVTSLHEASRKFRKVMSYPGLKKLRDQLAAEKALVTTAKAAS